MQLLLNGLTATRTQTVKADSSLRFSRQGWTVTVNTTLHMLLPDEQDNKTNVILQVIGYIAIQQADAWLNLQCLGQAGKA